MFGNGLKDELREIGRDVASSLKDELKGVAKEKATAFVKEQFGLGFQDELKAAGRDILDEVGSQLKGAAKEKATKLIREQLGLGYGGLKDELREIGRDVASSLKDELKGVAKEKATAFVKEQFGLGFQDELKAAGRDILDEVGSQLKGAAKDKATELIREQLGLGVVDRLKSAERRLRGKPTDAEMRERLQDVASNLGQPLMSTDPLKGVRSAGTKMLLEQLGMDGGAFAYGGSGIARPCAIKVGELRKAVTAARRANHIVGRANKEQMVDIGEGHADLGGRHARAVGKYLDGDLTVPRLREMRGLIKGAYHRPVSGMTMGELIEYVFWTAKKLGWDWKQLDGIAPKKRQPRGCRVSKHPGRNDEPQEFEGRKVSDYNRFVGDYIKQALEDFDSGKRRPEGWKAPMAPPTVADYMKEAAAAWKSRAPRRTAARKAAQTRRNKKEEAERRAQVRKEVRAERAATKRQADDESRQRNNERFGEENMRRKIPRKAKANAPKQYGKGAAYDSGSDEEM